MNESISDPILETPRVVVRRFTLEDAAFIHALVNDPAWIEHIGDRNVRSLEDARDYLETRVLASYRRHGFGMWVVFLLRRQVAVSLFMSGQKTRR